MKPLKTAAEARKASFCERERLKEKLHAWLLSSNMAFVACWAKFYPSLPTVWILLPRGDATHSHTQKPSALLHKLLQAPKHTHTHIRNRSWRAGWSASCFLSKSLILTPQKEHRGIVTYLKTTVLQFPLWKNTAFVCGMCLSGLLRGCSAWALVQTESFFFGKMRIWAGKATNCRKESAKCPATEVKDI